MPRKRTVNGAKSRRLWLSMTINRRPKGTPPQAAIAKLAEIADKGGDFQLPPGYSVTIRWRNHEYAPMREGEFSQELRESALSSPGFNRAVAAWLGRKLSALESL